MVTFNDISVTSLRASLSTYACFVETFLIVSYLICQLDHCTL